MAAHSMKRLAVLCGIVTFGCGPPPDLSGPATPLPEFEFLSEGFGILDPDRIPVGRPVSTGSPVPFYPEGEDWSRLADCGCPPPRCDADAPCLGWVRFSFKVSESGEPFEALFAGACPYPVAQEPFRQALATWRFRPWEIDDRAGKYSVTTLAYPIPVDSRKDPTRRITSP